MAERFVVSGPTSGDEPVWLVIDTKNPRKPVGVRGRDKAKMIAADLNANPPKESPPPHTGGLCD